MQKKLYYSDIKHIKNIVAKNVRCKIGFSVGGIVFSNNRCDRALIFGLIKCCQIDQFHIKLNKHVAPLTRHFTFMSLCICANNCV